MKKLVLLNYIMFSVITSFSMSAVNHNLYTFNAFFGWEGPNFASFISNFNAPFDIQKNFPIELREALKGSGVEGSHRRFGHWAYGMEVPFEKLTYEMKYVREFTPDQKRVITKYWQEYVVKKQIELVTQKFGFNGKQAENMAALIHDLHLLQDYTDDKNYSLQKPAEVFDDIYDRARKLTGDSKDVVNLINKLKKMDNPINSKEFQKLFQYIYDSHESTLKKMGISKKPIDESILKKFKKPEFTNKMIYHNNREFFANKGIEEVDFLQNPDVYKKDLKKHKSDFAKIIDLKKSTYKEFKSVLRKNEISEDIYLKNPDKYKKIIDDYKKTFNYKIKQDFKLSAQAGLMAFGFEMLNSLVFEGEDLGEALYDSAIKGGVAGGATFIAEGLISSLGNGKFALTTLVDEQSIVKKAFGTGVNYCLITFIIDESMIVYSWAVKGCSGEELLEDTVKNAMVASSSFLSTSVMVLCGFAPGGIVVMAVAFGAEVLVSTTIDKAYEYHAFKNYLMEDDYIGFLPAEFLNTETPWNQPENETPWNQPENETPWNQPENETPWNY